MARSRWDFIRAMFLCAGGRAQTVCTTQRQRAWKPAEAMIRPMQKDSCGYKASRAVSSDVSGRGSIEARVARREWRVARREWRVARREEKAKMGGYKELKVW